MKENKLMTYRSFGKKYGRETLQQARNNRMHRSRDLLNLSDEINEKDLEKLKFQYELDNVIRDIEKASILSEDIKNKIIDLKNTVANQKDITDLRRKSQVQKGSGKRRVSAKKHSTKKRSTKKRFTKKRSTKKRSIKKRSTKKRSSKKRSTKKRSTKKRSTKKRSTKKRSIKKRSTKKRSSKKRSTKKRSTKKRSTKKRSAKKLSTKKY